MTNELFHEEKKIKHVIIYARKSRGDDEKDLEKHLIRMKATCKTYNWTYEIFQEIKSGSTIVDRPVMLEVLDLIENTNRFDALVVFDQDRLSRGGSTDQQQIMYILKKSNTKLVICNPYQLLDPNNESHEELMSIRSFTAQFELRNTKKRFSAGKKIGASMGNWVYGVAPYGYKYNKKTKRLVLHEEESKILLRIKQEYLEGKSISDITWGLNSEGVRSRSGGMWNKNVIRSMLKNEVYTGVTIFNKSEGTPENRSNNRYSISNPYKKNPKSEWKYVHNTHPVLITEEENKYIVNKIESKQKNRSDIEIKRLSGLVRTPNGSLYSVRHQCTPNVLTSSEKEYRDIPCYIVEDAILITLDMMKNQLAKNLKEKDTEKEVEYYKKQINDCNTKIKQATVAIDKVKEGFLSDIFTADEVRKVQNEKNIIINQLEEEKKKWGEKISSVSSVANIDRIERIDTLLNSLKNKKHSDIETNILYKDIISSITAHRREDDDTEIVINFL